MITISKRLREMMVEQLADDYGHYSARVDAMVDDDGQIISDFTDEDILSQFTTQELLDMVADLEREIA